MYFNTKNYLKSNRNHTVKYTFSIEYQEIYMAPTKQKEKKKEKREQRLTNERIKRA